MRPAKLGLGLQNIAHDATFVAAHHDVVGPIFTYLLLEFTLVWGVVYIFTDLHATCV